jgi:DNA modification methylase
VSARIIVADVFDGLATIEPESVQCCVTSPPYWGLRDYGMDGQIGLERTLQEYLDTMVRVFGAVRRVMRKDATLWLNLGDCYNAYNGGSGPGSGPIDGPSERSAQRPQLATGYGLRDATLKPKDLVGMPWMTALALRSAGWWLRSDIVWSKPNPMPESVRDRPTRSHEYLFLLARSERYYYDADAIAEPRASTGLVGVSGWASGPGSHAAIDHARDKGDARSFRGGGKYVNGHAQTADPVERDTHGNGPAAAATRTCRSVWTIATQPFPDAHFATFPEALVLPCVLAGSRPGDLVLDPFAGSGTVGLVADRLGRDFVGVELNPKYAAIAERRITSDAPLFADVETYTPASVPEGA